MKLESCLFPHWMECFAHTAFEKLCSQTALMEALSLVKEETNEAAIESK